MPTNEKDVPPPFRYASDAEFATRSPVSASIRDLDGGTRGDDVFAPENPRMPPESESTWNPLNWFSSKSSEIDAYGNNRNPGSSEFTTSARASIIPGIPDFYQKWVKWYYVLPAIFVFFYIILLGESFADSRRNRRKDAESGKNIEGMMSRSGANLGKIRGIMRREDDIRETKKRVSFQMNQYKTNLSGFFSNSALTIREYFVMIYEMWIMPGIYLLIRTVGLR